MADQALLERITGLTVKELRGLARMTHGIKPGYHGMRKEELRAALVAALDVDVDALRAVRAELYPSVDRSRPAPMETSRRAAGYLTQTGRTASDDSDGLTPAQRRRARRKANRAGGA
jgi:hypothetical protein